MLLLLPVLVSQSVGILAWYRNDVPITERLFQVALYLAGILPKQWCGGSIVSIRAVLTTAKCLHGKTHEDILIRAGSDDLLNYTNPDWYTVRSVISHEQFGTDRTEWSYDIGLVVTSKDFIFGPTKQAIGMTMAPAVQGDSVTVSGFGVIVPTFINRATHLATKTLQKASSEFCQRRVKEIQPLLPNLTDTQLCVQDSVEDLNQCIINVGGPVTSSDGTGELLIGVVSWASGCTLDRKPSTIFYVDVTPFRDWIKNHTDRYQPRL